MNEVSLTILSLSLSGSLIALFLLLLKPIIKDRLSKTWQYYIFLVVVIRLLLPFGPDTSLMGMLFNRTENHIVVENNPDAMPDMDNIFGGLSTEAPQEQPCVNAESPVPPKANIGQILIKWLWLAWFVPAAWLLMRKVISYCRYMRFIARGCDYVEDAHTLELYWDTCKSMGIGRFPALVKNEQIASPMLIGTIRNVIILPDAALKDVDMQYIFQHELTHYKRLDIVYKWLVQIAACIHWFNPIVYWISREINRNCELSCDEAVIKGLDENSKHAYGDMLLDTIKLDRTASPAIVSITLNEDTKLIKERLKAIMAHKKHSRKLIIVSALLAVFLLSGATFAGAYTAKKPSESPINSEPLPNDAALPIAVQPPLLNSSLQTNAADTEVTVVYEDENANSSKPTSQELSKEEAAGIGVRQLTDVFDLDLNGETINMRYIPAADGRRSSWMGIWNYEGSKPNPNYSFRVDALTGSVNNVLLSRTLELQDIADQNSQMIDLYKENPEEFETYAKQIAQELDVVEATIKTFQLYSQDVTTEHNVTFEATGESGKRGWLIFSRHDKALLAVVYNSGIPELEKYWQ